MNQVALVTGSARRIGASIAQRLHQNGMNVVIHYKTSFLEANSLVKSLNELRPDSALLCQADLSVCESMPLLIRHVIDKWGRLDVLVNNASNFYPTPLGHVTEAAWDDLHAGNVKGAFFLSQAAFVYLKKERGVIINITDIHTKKPLKNYAAYTIAKAGLSMMTKVLAREMAPYVRVNAIAPGSILWPEAENTPGESQKNEIIERTLLKKQGSPEDIAGIVHFLCQAKYITGEIITVDGGASIR